jgi:hypothetical protein
VIFRFSDRRSFPYYPYSVVTETFTLKKSKNGVYSTCKMSKHKKPKIWKPHLPVPPSKGVKIVSSLLDSMQDGNEYGSIVSVVP